VGSTWTAVHRAAKTADTWASGPGRLVAAAAASARLIRHSTLENIESYDAFAHSSLSGWTIAVAAPGGSMKCRPGAMAACWAGGGRRRGPPLAAGIWATS
jgi:hypothetical protein